MPTLKMIATRDGVIHEDEFMNELDAWEVFDLLTQEGFDVRFERDHQPGCE